MNNRPLVEKEKELRCLLGEANEKFRKSHDFKLICSPDYAKSWKKWSWLREEGVNRGLFAFFVPSKK